MHFLVMSFSFSLKPGGPIGSRQKISNPFGDTEEESQTSESNQKPLDYVKARIESEQRRVALAAAVARHANFEGDEDESGEPESVDRSGVPLGPAAVAARGGSSTSSFEKNATGVSAISRPGLVLLGDQKSDHQKTSKHIQRMVETSQVNEKFKNLLKIKIAEKEKVKAEEEYGSKPEEFVTSAYLKQRQESLALERELEAKESNMKKRDMTNLFREMLDSGSYARSNFHEVKTDVGAIKVDRSVGLTESAQKAEITPEQVQKILDKVVPEESKEISKAIEKRTRIDVMKIVQQVEEIVGNEGGEEEVEERRMSAKQRYLERKRQKLNEQ